MTYFPHPPVPRPAASSAYVQTALTRDILWNQPVFKAPKLPIPRIAPEPLPFTAVRITQRPVLAGA